MLPVEPVGPCAPISPVLANVIKTSSPLLKGDDAELSTLLIVTSKYPVSSLIALIVYNRNLELSSYFVNLTCPLIVDEESSIVLKYA